MDVSTVSSSILGALKSGLTFVGELASGVKDGILRMFTDGTITEGGVYSPTNISTAGIILLVFGGVALAFGICKLCFHIFRSKIG